ncbi:MAG TPA: DUF3800 domain-containing protein [Puia sp.]|nr:DUF3800 domain-containing protein [Puia sp.]
MAYFLFIDESGQDHRESPYEVLAGFAIEDKVLWKFISEVHDIEMGCFGRKYSLEEREAKGRKFLKRKTYKLAAQMDPIDLFERAEWSKEALEHGKVATRNQITALAQAKLAYVKQVFQLCQQYRCKIFASIVKDPKSLPSDPGMLRKDYIYLFERFFYFLEDTPGEPQGVVVFDELDKSKSHILLNQMDRYFKHTAKGRARSSLVIPEPFFVHSDLTTGIQIVDFAAYIISWNFRVHGLEKPVREELNSFTELIKTLRYRTTRSIGNIDDHEVWSICMV